MVCPIWVGSLSVLSKGIENISVFFMNDGMMIDEQTDVGFICNNAGTAPVYKVLIFNKLRKVYLSTCCWF